MAASDLDNVYNSSVLLWSFEEYSGLSLAFLYSVKDIAIHLTLHIRRILPRATSKCLQEDPRTCWGVIWSPHPWAPFPFRQRRQHDNQVVADGAIKCIDKIDLAGSSPYSTISKELVRDFVPAILAKEVFLSRRLSVSLSPQWVMSGSLTTTMVSQTTPRLDSALECNETQLLNVMNIRLGLVCG